MLLWLAGCIWDAALYRERRDALTDDDGDGFTEVAGDCEDRDGTINPAAAELCDGVDQDCDGVADDGLDGVWFRDEDGDGAGDPADSVSGCAAPEGFVATAGDCAPADPGVAPGREDVPYDGVDQDCSGGDLRDVDGDGYDGADGDDCDDQDATVFPGAPETWDDDGVDNDCDGVAFEAIEWGAEAALDRIDGPAAGAELGRRVVWAGDEGCLLVTAPYATSGRGAVFAERPGAGERVAGGNGVVTGTWDYGYLAAAQPPSDDGLIVLVEPGAEEGRGRVYLVSLAPICDGGGGATEAVADRVLAGEEVAAFLGADVRWLPDADGDGLTELLATAPYASGGGRARGSAMVWSGETLATGATSVGDADIVLTGDWDDASLAVAPVARDTSRGIAYLVVAERPSAAGAPSVRRIPLDSLTSGALASVSDGALTSEDPSAPLPTTNLGDIDGDGVDELAVGSSPIEFWGLDDITGTRAVSEARGFAEENDASEYISAVAPLGDVNGDTLADFLLGEDDWPATTARGRAGIFLGDRTTTATATSFDTLPWRLVGDEAGDQFGYAATSSGDFNENGRPDVAITAYGSDHAAPGAGTVYIVDIP